jgi:hypothetical protein
MKSQAKASKEKEAYLAAAEVYQTRSTATPVNKFRNRRLTIVSIFGRRDEPVDLFLPKNGKCHLSRSTTVRALGEILDW